MSDYPPPDFAAGAAVAGGSALTPEAITAVLDEFRAWLTAAANEMEPTPAEGPTVDLFTLVGQFTALRHEVNLQTRAVRAQQEQNTQTLRHLAEALDSLTLGKDQSGVSAEDLVRPLLKTLVDLYDSASLAGRELQRVEELTSAALRPLEEIALEAMKANDKPSWWARLLGASTSKRKARQEQSRTMQEGAERIRRTLTATAAGYAMTLQRVERAMEQHGLEPIAAVGEPFDPDRMEALEVVIDSGRPAGEVVEEVRRGYSWQGRVFRYAQVRVAKHSAS
jgi:molecular chaperone GrpE